MTSEHDQRVNLTGAARAAGVTTQTLLRWRRESEAAADDRRPARTDLFQVGEFETTERRIGGGQEWSLALAAVERVHRARGGVTFYAEAALGGGRISARAAAEMEALRTRLAEMEIELARIRQEQRREQRSAEVARTETPPHTLASAPPHRRPFQSIQAPTPFPRVPWPPAPSDTGPVEQLPAGWEAASTLMKDRDVDPRAARRYVQTGRWPAPHVGRWTRGGNALITRAWDTAQQAAIQASGLDRRVSGEAESAPESAPGEFSAPDDDLDERD